MANGQGILAENDAVKQEIARLESQIAQIQGGGLQQAGLTNTYSKSSLPPEDISGVYGLLAQYGDDPQKAGSDYVRAMQTQGQLTSAGSAPSNVREWEFYNALPEQEKKAYLEMKRGISLKNLAGGQAAIYGGGLGGPEFYSTLAQERAAIEQLKASGAYGAAIAQRFDMLGTSRTARYENYSEAQRLRQLVSQNDLPTGLYTGLVYKVLPTADQESLDALSEFVARQRLKASGEIRPTDADVQGMKRALFGSDRTEEFTVDSLDRLLRELQGQEDEYTQLQQYFMQAAQSRPAPYVPGASPQQTPQYGGPPPPREPQEQIDYSNMTFEQMRQILEQSKASGRY